MSGIVRVLSDNQNKVREALRDGKPLYNGHEQLSSSQRVAWDDRFAGFNHPSALHQLFRELGHVRPESLYFGRYSRLPGNLAAEYSTFDIVKANLDLRTIEEIAGMTLEEAKALQEVVPDPAPVSRIAPIALRAGHAAAVQRIQPMQQPADPKFHAAFVALCGLCAKNWGKQTSAAPLIAVIRAPATNNGINIGTLGQLISPSSEGMQDLHYGAAINNGLCAVEKLHSPTPAQAAEAMQTAFNKAGYGYLFDQLVAAGKGAARSAG